MKQVFGFATTTLCMTAALLPLPATAQTAPAADAWQFSAMLYGYFPTIGGKSNFPFGSGSGVSVDASTILDHLQGGFLGSLEVRKGSWGAFTDVMYLDVGNSNSGTYVANVGGLQVPINADAKLDLKGLVWTLAGTYRAVDSPQVKLDVLAGARMLDIEQTLDLSGNGVLGLSVNSKLSKTLWDGIVGVKGQVALGDERKWFIPYYLDVGTGQSDLTWQIMSGIGYSYSWGQVLAGWRYLDYQMKAGEKLESVYLNGPMLGVAFSW
ncbi:MAG: hypothetical protein IPN40_16640 [Uliginosibacterium sp.]|nr:hypothetical protein [Uliginosibacterium sp.]